MEFFWSCPPEGGFRGGVGTRGQSYEFPLAYLKPCVWCLYLDYLMGWFRIWKKFLIQPPRGWIRGGARGQSYEFPLAYLQPCVWCLYLCYLIGWFRIWKSFLDPAPLGADSGGGGGKEEKNEHDFYKITIWFAGNLCHMTPVYSGFSYHLHRYVIFLV